MIGWGLGLQILLAVLILATPWDWMIFDTAHHHLGAIANNGASLVFGPLADPAYPDYVGFVFACIFAGTGLVVIIFFAALMSVQ